MTGIAWKQRVYLPVNAGKQEMAIVMSTTERNYSFFNVNSVW